MRVDVLLAELMQSWRALLRKPGYLVLASITLALGITACVGVFALVDASLLQRLAVPQADRVVVLGPLEEGRIAGGLAPIAYQHLDGVPGVTLMGIAAPQTSAVNVSDGDRPATVMGWKVSGSFLATLGLPMQVGRTFNSEESQPNGPAAVIVSYAYWQQNLGGKPDVVNQMLHIDGRSIPLVGILSPHFPYQNAQLLLPLALQPNDQSWAGDHKVLARLAPGVSYASVSSEVHAKLRQLDAQHQMDLVGHRDAVYGAQPLSEVLRTDAGSGTMLKLFGACATLVLLIVLVNLTNLSLLRILSRSHDSAVRLALGAPTARLLLPATAEQLLVAVFGSAIGLFFAWASLRLAGAVIPPDWFISAAVRPQINAASILFAFFLGVFVTLLALMMSAWRTRNPPLRETLAGGERSGGEREVGRLGRLLVIVQAALATVLLILAALSAKTLWNASQVDYGFDNSRVLAFTVKPDRNTYPSQQQMMAMADAMVMRLESLPGVGRAAYGTDIPASGSDFHDTVPFLTPDGGSIESVVSYLVSPGYLEVLGIQVQQGASFEASHAANTNVMLVSADLQKVAPDDTALGQQLALPYRFVNPAWSDQPLQVRGATNGVRALGPNAEMPPVAWVPFMAGTEHLYDVWRDVDNLYFIMSVQGDPATYTRQVATAAHEVAPNLPIAGLRPMREYQAANLSRQKLNLTLISIFACVALLLASEGMYSVMAVSVASRRHELGVRAALGAQPMHLLRHVLVDAGIQVGIGLLIGLSIAFAASRLIQRFLFGVAAADWLSIVVVLIVLSVAGLLACLGPAMRAARIEPMQAFRTE